MTKVRYPIRMMSFKDFKNTKLNKFSIYCIVPNRYDIATTVVILDGDKFTDSRKAASSIKRFVRKNFSFGIGVKKTLHIIGMFTLGQKFATNMPFLLKD